MALDKLVDFLGYGTPRPNKFTIFLGEQIKNGRIEQGLSQEELAKLIYKRRATVSDIEKGKGLVDADMLAMFSHILDKPLGYFYPEYAYREMKRENLSPLENELLVNFKKIVGDNLQKLAVDLIRVFGNYDPKDLVIELFPDIKERLEREKAREERLAKRRKKK